MVGGFVTRLTAYDADDGGYVLSYHFDNEVPSIFRSLILRTISKSKIFFVFSESI